MTTSYQLPTTTKDAIEPRMASTLLSRGGGAESGGTRDGGPASLDAIASFETCERSSEVFQRETEALCAMEHGASNYKPNKTLKTTTCEDETAGLGAGGETARENGGSGGSFDDAHGTTALPPLVSSPFEAHQGEETTHRGKKLVCVVCESQSESEPGR